jgi:hypothetical protein
MDSTDAAGKTGEHSGHRLRPVIVDLGKKTRKAIRNLKRGTGTTMLEVEEVINRVRQRLPEGERNRSILPVVIIYQRKRRRLRVPSLPFSPFNLLR